MKIRKKITLWIAGVALLSTISFSLFVVFELAEQPFDLIDRELQHIADDILLGMNETFFDSIKEIDVSSLPYDPTHYWIKISDNEGNIFYQSDITKYTDIPSSDDKKTYNIERNIPRDKIWLGQDDDDDVAFRVKVVTAMIGLHPVTVRIAKPIEDIEEEYISLLREYAVSLLFCTLFIIISSYKLAGKILQPIASISSMTQEINEDSLDKRIPLNKTKDEFYDLSSSLNTMFDRLQYSFARQREFISNASHELKSPITLLKLSQEDLLINYELPSQVRTNLDRQLNTTLRMSKLVRDLLDLSRLEHIESITIAQVDIKERLDKVLDDYSDLLKDKNIRVDSLIEDALVLRGDQEKLLRLMINLIDNSIRYNKENGGVIQITGKRQKGLIVLELSNTGEQIPSKDLDFIFDQFYRVEKSRSMAHGGSGLGLTIAKKIIELHGGTITISNAAEGLIKVAITLPIKPYL